MASTLLELGNLYFVLFLCCCFLVQIYMMYIAHPPISLPLKSNYTCKTMVHGVANEGLTAVHI